MSTWTASAQSNTTVISGSYAAQCDTAYPVNVGAHNCNVASPWTITLTDSAAVPNSVSTPPLVRIGYGLRIPISGEVPTLNITGLVSGPGTMTVTDPCGGSVPFAFNIVGCSGSSALVTKLGAMSVISPIMPLSYTVEVVNLGPSSSTATTLEVTGIPSAGDVSITVPPASGMTIVDLGGSQKISIPLTLPLAAGATATYVFTMQSLALNAGDTFTLQAGFTTTYPYTDQRQITCIASIDPNAKYGNTGAGAFHSVPSNSVLPYLVMFENDPSAFAPAQIVRIKDQLDTTKLIPESVQFGSVFFGNKAVTLPTGTIPFSTTVPYSADSDADPFTPDDNIFVRISGDVDRNPASTTYGKVEVMFESLNAPGGTPPPPWIGFLPPDIYAPAGQGGVSFTAIQKPNLAPGTFITNVASIVFDVNAPILTPVWTNRITLPSALSVDQINAGQVRVTWTGGTLEQSSTVAGGLWTNSPVQISPWTFGSDEPQKFFRVRND